LVELSFQVERKIGAGSYALLATTAANTTSYSSTGLSTGTQYSYRVRATNASGNSAYTTDAIATPTSAPSGTTNLALNKTVTASLTDPSHPTTHATDAITTAGNYWGPGQGSSATQFVTVDLGSTQSISSCKFTWVNVATNRPTAYTIQVSNSQTTGFTTVYTTTAASMTTNLENITFPSASGRYVKLSMTAMPSLYSFYGYQLVEFEIYGQPVNKALNKTVTASINNPSYPPQNATDGNSTAGNFWGSGQSQSVNQTVTIDLGSTQNIARCKLTWEAATTVRATAYTIQVSNSPTTGFTTAYTTTAASTATNIDDFTFASASGRYVRLSMTAGAGFYGYQLNEFEIY
jgi:F5/8 type C domain